MISVSIVLYNHNWGSISNLIEALTKVTQLQSIFLVDNSSIALNIEFPEKVVYIFNDQNLGYGRAHNIALEKSLEQADYHLVLNPDISLTPEALEQMLNYMDQHPNIGLLMPKVLYPSGEIQHLCKLMPTPFDLIMRRFIPSFMQPWFTPRMEQYELKNKDYNAIMEVPNLSGCFMLLRCEALKFVGLFDDRFFMYLEDTDLCRRMNLQFQTVYYPEVSIIHHYEKGSYKKLKLLLYHISSAFKYFMKYGWYFDTVRTTINRIAAK